MIKGLAVFTLLGAMLMAWLLAVEDRLVYFPTRVLVATPADYGLAYERIALKTGDDLSLMAWVMPGEGERWLIYFHGNGENISRYLSLMPALRGLGFNLLLFDYRGYGESEGVPSEAGLYMDARAAYGFLREGGVAPENIYLYGFSLGTGVAVQLATEVEVAGMVLEAAYTSLPAAGRHAYPFLPTALMQNRYDSLGKIERVGAPVIFLHSPEDRTVPLSHGKILYDTALSPKAFVEVTGGHVAMLQSPPDARGLEAIRTFLELP